ncbi:penicillin acylase family protein [Saccharopolyspora taberi]|uniref:Penicillin acylase family protein n=1 Tax=Saccharopolyspora taberi TaxID=60895 RepID=A0ABN3VFP1_9PSEU
MSDPAQLSRRSVLAAATALGVSATTATGAHAREAGGAAIVRDTWGTPHVYASTRRDLFRGYGYSVAEDRLFQLDMARRSFTGRVAEVLGADHVEHDRSVRAETDTPSIRGQYDRLPRQDRDVVDGYAEGVNERIREVLADRGNLLPRQYSAHGFDPTPWTGLDVVMIFVGTMAVRFSDTTVQAANLATLTELVEHFGPERGRELFDQLVWRDDPDAPTTVPSAPARVPHVLPALSARQSAIPVLPEAAGTGPVRFSNAWLIGGGKTRSGGAILVNGPQFGFFRPAYTYSVGLHGAGFDVVGNTPFGYPVVLFGHNEHIAWGSTAGMGTSVDLYAEQLNPADPDEYLFNGSYRRMDERTETIAVRGADPVTTTVRSTVHGLVTAGDPAGGVAYSTRRAWAGKELESLFGWLDSTRARSWPEWLEQAGRNATSINWYYADRDGNIGYVHTGRYPKRRPGVDPRLPMSGTGDMEWLGLQPFSWNPKVFNPEQGFIANWNNKPAAGYEGTSSWSSADRVNEITDLLRDRSDITPRQAWDVIAGTSLLDVNARYFLGALRSATADLPEDSDEARAVGLLGEWDRANADRDGDGRYDHPGGAIMRAWLERMVGQVVAGLPAGVREHYGRTGYPDSSEGIGSLNISPGVQLVHNALRGPESGVPQKHDLFGGRPVDEVVREALGAAIEDLRHRHGPDMRQWKAPVVPATFDHENFAGIPQALPEEAVSRGAFMNRGSQNDIVVLDRDGITAAEVCAPGQSGFVAPDGATGAHYQDQLDLFLSFRNKPVWFTPDEVRAHQSSVRHLP